MGLLESKAATQADQTQNPEVKARLMKVQEIALAALRILYDEKMLDKFKPLMKGDDPVQAAAEVAYRLMLLVMMAAKMQMDPKNIIPAGTLLIGDVLDFIEKARGIKHTEEQADAAIELFVRKMMETVQ